MVDINLFKEEEDDKEQEWTPSPEDVDAVQDKSHDHLEFDENIGGSSILDDDSLLDEDESIHNFDAGDDKESFDEDFDFGETNGKKTPIWLWAFLGLVVIVVFLYLFVFQPRQGQRRRASTSNVQRPALITDRQAAGGDQTANDTTASETLGASGITSTGSAGGALTVVSAAKTVFKNLAEQGQLGTIIIEGNQFRVSYVSAAPNVSKMMGERVKTLLGATSYQVSPEDRHQTGGRVRYWGVISGSLPLPSQGVIPSTPKRFATADQFITSMRTLVETHRLSVKQAETFSRRTEGSLGYNPIRLKLEGPRENVLNYLEAVKGMTGNFIISKITIAPLVISDFQARQVKLVLECKVATG